MLEVEVASLKSSKHDLARHRVLIFLSCTLIKRLPHHQDSIAIIAKLELDVCQLRHRDAHGIFQVLLSQVLNLEFLLVDSTLVLQTGLLLPLLVEQVADDWVLTILLFQVTIVDPSEVLVLSM